MHRSWLAALALSLGGCELLFPLEEFGPPKAAADDAGGGADADTPSLAYRDEVLADAPVFYLRFGDRGGLTAREEMKQRDATYGSGVTLGAAGAISGDTDTAVTFSGGGSSRVTIPAGFDFPGKAAFSVEIWVLPLATSNLAWFVDHQVYGSGRNGWGFALDSDHLTLERWANGSNTAVSSPSPLARGKYQHVVATFDGARSILYVDGVAIAETSEAKSMQAMTAPWSGGAQNCGDCATNNFVGSLDELAIYDKALSGERVLAHFHAAGR